MKVTELTRYERLRARDDAKRLADTLDKHAAGSLKTNDRERAAELLALVPELLKSLPFENECDECGQTFEALSECHRCFSRATASTP